jgi:hypothetical protein
LAAKKRQRRSGHRVVSFVPKGQKLSACGVCAVGGRAEGRGLFTLALT